MVNYLRAYYYLQSLQRRLYWPEKRLKKFQNKKLQKMLKTAYHNVPYYRKQFKAARIKPDQVKTVEDLTKIPILNKDEIRKNLSQMISTNYRASQLKIHRTSGSTGEPLRFYISDVEDEYRKARHIRANTVCGQKLRDRYVTITHPLYFSQTTKLQRLLRFYAPIPVSVFDDVDKQIRVVEKVAPDLIDGYASSILLLAKHVDKLGVTKIRPRFLISGADLISIHSRKCVERIFDAPFYDQYGCAELERLAWQCEKRNGYHIDADSIIIEFVDSDGDKVAPGETGIVVCTSLFNYAMPFIRYAVGDIGKAAQEQNCSCGRTFPLMEVVEGREGDIITLANGRAISSFAFIAAMYQLGFYDKIEKFRIVQKSQSLFRVLIKMNNSSVNARTAEGELLRLFRRVFDVGQSEVSFEIEFVGDIPPESSGKFGIVVSELG